MRTIVEVAIYALPILGVYLYLKKTNRWTEKTQKMLGIGGLVFVLGLAFGSTSFGVKKIGALFERSEYQTKYYVLMYPDFDRAKNYKLQAEIEVTSEEDEDRSYKVIWLRRVFFPNGNAVYFDGDESLEFGKKVIYYDSDRKKWGVELIDQKVE